MMPPAMHGHDKPLLGVDGAVLEQLPHVPAGTGLHVDLGGGAWKSIRRRRRRRRIFCVTSVRGDNHRSYGGQVS